MLQIQPNIKIVSCVNCVKFCKTGDAEQARDMIMDFKKAGYKKIIFLCKPMTKLFHCRNTASVKFCMEASAACSHTKSHGY